MILVNDVMQTIKYKGSIETNINKTKIKKIRRYYSYIVHVMQFENICEIILLLLSVVISIRNYCNVQPLIPQYVLSTTVNYS